MLARCRRVPARIRQRRSAWKRVWGRQCPRASRIGGCRAWSSSCTSTARTTKPTSSSRTGWRRTRFVAWSQLLRRRPPRSGPARAPLEVGRRSPPRPSRKRTRGRCEGLEVHLARGVPRHGASVPGGSTVVLDQASRARRPCAPAPVAASRPAPRGRRARPWRRPRGGAPPTRLATGHGLGPRAAEPDAQGRPQVAADHREVLPAAPPLGRRAGRGRCGGETAWSLGREPGRWSPATGRRQHGGARRRGRGGCTEGGRSTQRGAPRSRVRPAVELSGLGRPGSALSSTGRSPGPGSPGRRRGRPGDGCS